VKILLVTQYFFPEVTSCALRMDEFATVWASRGHDVTVLTAVPNHPEGVVHPGYRGRTVVREQRGGAAVTRVWVKVTPKRSAVGRLVSYASFAASSAAVGALGVDRPDVVVATSPPPVAALTGRLLAWRFRVPYVLDIRDLWPQAAVAVGELGEGGLASRLIGRGMDALYRGADLVTAATEGFAREIGPGTVVIPNGADRRVATAHAGAGDRVRRRLGLEGRFVVGYVGNHGVCEGLEGLVDAAERLADRPDVHVLMVGSGPRRDALVARAAGRPNITLHPPVPVEEVGAFLQASDVLVVPLRNEAHFSTRFPAKLYDAWASGKPVVVGYDGEARRLAESTGSGTYAPSDDPDALSTEIRRLVDLDPAELAVMGKNGRDWVERNATRSAGARTMAEHLEQLVEKTGRR
jgi:glycosyltransferase involved in cell wall biosynthesis